MPPRRSEAYDDPLRKRSHASTTSKGVPGRLPQEKERFVTLQESQIEWSNLIFLPFHPVFQKLVVYSVFIKATLGPILSVYPIVYCNDVMDYNPMLVFIKYCYWYLCDTVYGIDTFLHIVHRQVVDKAMRREHLPKSAALLIIDLIALIPFFRLVETETCPAAKMWPNILAFNEFLVIYRMTDFFSLSSTHSYLKLLFGYTIVLGMCINCITCFWLLMTHQGFCNRCNDQGVYYDWRGFVLYKLQHETNEAFATFIYACVFVMTFATNAYYDHILPSALPEFLLVCMFLVASNVLDHYIVIPKAFAESMLRFRRISTEYPRVKKVIEETKRRSPNDKSYKEVENYYKLLWRRRSCITETPSFYKNLPRYLRLEINQDLLWPLFYHSPSLRKTTYPFRRWLSEYTTVTFKLPGDKFFSHTKSHGRLYYLKSGIVQFLSVDDGVTPIISVSGGTILGDISFYVPHMKRKVLTRCLTYCELFYVDREVMIKGLHKYPVDRQIVMSNAQEKLKHAMCLFNNKKYVRGLDRNEDEGIAWVKRRWWEISNLIEHYLQKSGESRESMKATLPRDETAYHCAKYLGQLVLCAKTELKTKSMFTNFKFPWIMNEFSRFGYEWHRIVTITVFLVLCLHPTNLIRTSIPDWFEFFSFASDTVYVIDIGVSLLTAVKKYDTVASTFSAVLFERFKSFTFILDILSTIWVEDLSELVGAPEYYYSLQFNRLIKVYVLFHGSYLNFDIRIDPIAEVCHKIGLIHFAFLCIISHLVFDLLYYIPQLEMTYFFGTQICSKSVTENCERISPFFGVAIPWLFEWLYAEDRPDSLYDIYVAIIVRFIFYVVGIYCKGRFISYLFLQNREILRYQTFVSHLKRYYQHHRLHEDLLKRLDRYFLCHWKHYKGSDVLNPNSLEKEARGIYWKAQGFKALQTIEGSLAFKYADPILVKELAKVSKFLVVPRTTTILVFGNQSKNVTWIVQGYIKCEYNDEVGEKVTKFYGPGSLLSVSAVFLQKVSFRTYTAYSECEILYISLKEFNDIYKKFPIEYNYLQECRKEFGPLFDKAFKKALLTHRDYQQKLRDRIYSTRMSMVSTSKVIADIQDTRSLPVEGAFWGEPESGFIQSWMLFRTVIVCINIISASMLGGVGAVSRWIFMMISAFCDCVSMLDIAIKLCIPYYKSDGVLVYDRRKCLFNYLTKGFMLDMIGALPWFSVLRALLSQEIDDDATFLINTLCKFAHMYILFAYFDYITDNPSVYNPFIMIIKWQIVNILIVMGSSHYLMVNCVHVNFNEKKELVDIILRNSCWMPNVFRLPEHLDKDQLHLIFAQSLNLAESGMMRMNFGEFQIDRTRLGIGFVLCTLGLLFWFISYYTLTLLVLFGRGDTVFQHSVRQLERFLKSERVEKHIITTAMDHFKYCWIRTKGINIQQLTNDRIGVVFRQDLSYYFYKKTFTILDSLIGGGEIMQRQLAGNSNLVYFLPGHDIFRNMDIVSNVCIVHRGRVNLFKDGKKIIVLTKGDIFGQLEGTKLRPITVTATAFDHVDLLKIDVVVFQGIINNVIKRNIAKSKQAKNHFMAAKNIFVENPYDTIKYLLRGRKTIQFPWSKKPYEARQGSWYSRWLFLAWLVNPAISSAFVVLFIILAPVSSWWLKSYIILITADVIDFFNLIAEFFTIDLVVRNKELVYQRIGWARMKNWRLYLDILTLLIPLGTFYDGNWRYQAARLFRMQFFYDYHIHFCKGFKSRVGPIIMKLVIILLVMHLFSSGWVLFACREPIPIQILELRHLNLTIDFEHWISPLDRKEGCARATRVLYDEFGRETPSFVVPRHWSNDYIIALTYILLIHTHTSLDTVMALSLKQVYYKVFITFFVYLIDMWIMAIATNYVFTKYRELYQYDYNVKTMMTYLIDTGLSKSLVNIVYKYTSLVWSRQKGDWLPELAYQAPPCLRQDLFTSLYIHHLDAVPAFRSVPFYFKRQLAARFKRMVIFPGKCIVREGDTFNTTYFIHEGEVEKWYTDASGEGQLLSVLYTNGYFGCVAGLFHNAGFQFSYYTRTVVDIVYLNLSRWEDLLECYPEVKESLYGATKQLKKELTSSQKLLLKK